MEMKVECMMQRNIERGDRALSLCFLTSGVACCGHWEEDEGTRVKQ